MAAPLLVIGLDGATLDLVRPWAAEGRLPVLRGLMQRGTWGRLRGAFPHHDGARSVVVLDVERIADSCGYGVPLYDYRGERPQLPAWAGRKGPAGVARYQAEKNRQSIDGLPGLRG